MSSRSVCIGCVKEACAGKSLMQLHVKERIVTRRFTWKVEIQGRSERFVIRPTVAVSILALTYSHMGVLFSGFWSLH
jgi:hypothetical protein